MTDQERIAEIAARAAECRVKRADEPQTANECTIRMLHSYTTWLLARQRATTDYGRLAEHVWTNLTSDPMLEPFFLTIASERRQWTTQRIAGYLKIIAAALKAAVEEGT